MHPRFPAVLPTPLTVDLDDAGGIATVRPVGEIDIASVDRLRDVLDQALNTGHDVLIDLCGCLFIDSTGIAQLLRTQRICDDRGVLMAVACPPSGPCARVLLLAARSWLELHDTRGDGWEALRLKRREAGHADGVTADPDRHAELSMLSEEQRRSLKGFLERHPTCCLEVQEFGKGFFVVRARQSERGSLIMERHIFPSVERHVFPSGKDRTASVNTGI